MENKCFYEDFFLLQLHIDISFINQFFNQTFFCGCIIFSAYMFMTKKKPALELFGFIQQITDKEVISRYSLHHLGIIFTCTPGIEGKWRVRQ